MPAAAAAAVFFRGCAISCIVTLTVRIPAVTADPVCTGPVRSVFVGSEITEGGECACRADYRYTYDCQYNDGAFHRFLLNGRSGPFIYNYTIRM